MSDWLVLLCWALGAYANAGFMLAAFQEDCGCRELAREEYRHDLALSIGVSLLVFTWVATPFLTGFYEHGWMKPTLHPKSAEATK